MNIKRYGYLIVVTIVYYFVGLVFWVFGRPQFSIMMVYALSYGALTSLWLFAGIPGGRASAWERVQLSHVERIYKIVDSWRSGGRGAELTLIEILRELAVRAVSLANDIPSNRIWSMDKESLEAICGAELASLITGEVKKINTKDIERFLRLIEVGAGWE